MRKPEQRPSEVAAIPHRIVKDGWWLVADTQIPCTGSERRCSGLSLVITQGENADHAGRTDNGG